MSTERFKNVTSFAINLLNNKTIILLNLAEYRLILADVIILRNRAEYRLILSRRGLRPCRLKSDDIPRD